MNDTEIIEARKKAERAVADMGDESLKVKAFEVIFNRLLSEQFSGHSHKVNSSRAGATGDSAPGNRSPVPSSTIDRIIVLKEQGFFTEPRGIGEVQRALRVHGWHYPLTNLSKPLQQIVQRRGLRRELQTDGAKKVFKYFNP